jgi:hypothetical protein
MTSEIAIMNKEAVALATDSAVTLSRDGGHKIFTSANKLFCLSNCCPIGVMVYGNARLMGVPWESIVKEYRKLLATRKFPKLSDYANDFIRFLNKPNRFIPVREQDRFFAASIYRYFSLNLVYEIKKKVKEFFEKQGKITDSDISIIVDESINKHYMKFNNLNSLQKSRIVIFRNIKTPKYSRMIDSIITSTFEKTPLNKSQRLKLKNLAYNIVIKDYFDSNCSGLVIAGFGENDTFPSLRSFAVAGKVAGKLRYKLLPKSDEISFDNGALIIPFAQSDMVATFMEGLHPDYKRNINQWLEEILNQYPKLIADTFNIKDKSKLKKLSDAASNMISDYLKKVSQYSHQKHIEPIVNVVSVLPRDELAIMAETLVNLTSFKKRVSQDLETVGGPIDVAVISKGDGFVWIKRKHYFKKELNDRYFSNFMREVINENKKRQN